MESTPFSLANVFLSINLQSVTLEMIIGFITVILLLSTSALISGSEVAFFSLSPTDLNTLRSNENRKNGVLLNLLKIPERLLATILIANNFVNVGIIILTDYLFDSFVNFSESEVLGFFIKVVAVTFLLLLFGEIIPKVYATQASKRFAKFMTYPLFILEKIFRPVSSFLIRSTSIVNKRFSQKKQNISIDDLSHALDLTSNSLSEEKQILEGIVNFGNIEVKGIMKPRMDVVSVDINTKYTELLTVIVKAGYSRIPIFDETFDKIKGILYIKDLLKYLNKDDSFAWQDLIRTPYFVPETKKINDLLEEFREKKIHLAIVIDEYGGTNGIVTMEDILEEIVGDINDEYDNEEEESYTQIDTKNFIFEAKTLIHDFCKITKAEENIFDEVRGDAETIAGLILELKAEIPQKNAIIRYKGFIFKITAVDNRRIKTIQITLP